MSKYHTESEQAVLGGLLLNPDAFDAVSDVLSEAAFWHQVHRPIYATISGMILRGEPVDVVTVGEHLERDSMLEQIGGLKYLTDLVYATPSTANIRRHAQIVADRYVERKLLVASMEIGEIVESSDTTAQKIDRAQAAIGAVAEQRSMDEPVTLKQAMIQAIDDLDERYTKGGFTGLSTGLKDLDAALLGLRPQSLMVIAGRPSMGKSALAMQIAEHVSETEPVLVFSLEMSPSDLSARLIAGRSRVPLERILTGSGLAEDDWAPITVALGQLSEHSLHIVDASILTVESLRAQARRMKRKHGLGLIVVDYLQLMTHGKDNAVEGIGDLSRGLKLLAKELNVPVIALSQLSRDCEKRPNKRPMMSDLRASGAIEQDADVVVMVYRDEVYNSDTQWKGIGELLVRKNRNGPLKDVITTFMGEYTRFENFGGALPNLEPTKPVAPRRDAYVV